MTQLEVRGASPEVIRERNSKLDLLFDRVSAAAHQADDARVKAEVARTAIEKLEARHPDHAASSLRVTARSIVSLAALPAAAVLDYLLDAPTIAYYAKAAELGPDATQFARLGVPAVVVLVEAGVNVMRSQGYEKRTLGFGSGEYWAWTAVAIGAVVASTLLVASAAAKASGHALLVAGVVGLTSLTHIVVLFGPLDDAKAWAVFTFVRWRHRSTRTTAEARRTRYEQATGRAFRRFFRMFEETGGQYQPGPIDGVTRTVVNTALGYDALPAPARDSRSGSLSLTGNAPNGSVTEAATSGRDVGERVPPAATTSAVNGSAEAASAAEVDYLRDVLRRRVRDDESAVTP